VSGLRLLIRNHKPTIVGITEVKPKNFRYDIEDAEIALDGYDMFGCSLHNKTGRGCAIYVKKTMYRLTLLNLAVNFRNLCGSVLNWWEETSSLLVVYIGVIVEPMKITNVY
jgi:exonuclease III